MRLISLLLAFCFSFNVLASSGTIQELERHIDDYQYSLSVEWDQKDDVFYEAKTKEFFGKIEKLIKEKGLSQEQIMNLVERKADNKAVIDALKMKLSLLPKGASTDDMVQIVKESVNDMYSQGASWNSAVVFQVVAWVIVAAIVGYSIWFEATYKCTAYETQYACHTYHDCYGPSTTSCTSTYTSCGYMDVCLNYEKQ